MIRPVRYALSGLCLLLAPVLFLQGAVDACDLTRQSPAVSCALARPVYSWNGFVLANLARAGLSVRQQGPSLALDVDEAGIELARRAFAAEPLATNALFVLTVAYRDAEQPDVADELLATAAALDKRNRYLGALQLERTARTGDLSATFAVIDRLAVVYPDLSREFVAPLVAALGNDGALEVIKGALEQQPLWGEAFWRSVPSAATLVDRMYQLRQLTSAGTTPQSDAELLAALVAHDRYADAFAFRDTLLGEGAEPLGFVAFGGTPPFGWDTTVSGDRSMAPQGDTAYQVFVQGGTEGELARQLVRLVPGRYQFSAHVAPESSAGAITAELECATSGATLAELALDTAVTWSVPGGCEAWWLVLKGSAWNGRESLRATLTELAFRTTG